MKSINNDNAVIGKRIKEIRLAKNMTQGRLARKVNLNSGKRISDIERGMCGLSGLRIMDICRALDVDADYLLFGTSTRCENNMLNKYFVKMQPEYLQVAEDFLKSYVRIVEEMTNT